MQKQRRKEMVQEYYQMKRGLVLPLKMRLYLSTLEGVLDRAQNSEISKQEVVDSWLIRTFQRQDEDQKVASLLALMKMLHLHYQSDEQHHSRPAEEEGASSINNIETTCSMETFSFRLSHWSTSKFKLDKSKRILAIQNKKKNFALNLRQYLVRKSKKNPFTIVLQAIQKDIASDYQKISLQFKEEFYRLIYDQLSQIVTLSIKDNLIQVARQSAEEVEPQEKSPLDGDNSFAFLTPEQITNYLAYKADITHRLHLGGFSFKNIYHKANNEEQVKIERSSKIDKIFKLQCLIKKPIEEIKKSLLAAINTKYKYKVQTNVLQQFGKKYRAVYDRYLISNKIYEQICIKEESNSQKEQIYFSKGMDNVLTGNNLEFMIAKVKPTENPKIGKLIIVVSLILSKDINLQIALAFLLEFRAMLDNTNGVTPVQVEQDDDEFFSIVQHPVHTNQDEFDSDQNKPDNKQLQQLVTKQRFVFDQQYLRHHYQLHSQQLSLEQLLEKKLKEHFFKNVWGRQKKGGLVCINEAMNQEQRNVIKKIMANLGSNLYKIVKSGNFMNCSLPLGIFKKASHLQLIGNNLAYAPILFDRFHQQTNVEVLQRFKYAILLNISISNLGISLQKPFNPILGQTLQCWIGGCPLYLQQVSHHPPISYYFFEGRGYKIYGCIDPKMSIGLNSLSCWSEKPNYIEFDDGSKICLTFGKMIMTGFIFGDRQFNYQDRTYLYDMKNHLFCTLYFGAKKKGIPKNEANDFVHGRIFKTHPSFLQKFTKSVTYPEKNDIQSQLSSFEGIWNQSIKFDGEQYINFSTELPYRMQKEQFPLPSNYSFRKDLSLYHEDNVVKAQQQKQILEQIQRRDRKLRQKYRT